MLNFIAIDLQLYKIFKITSHFLGLSAQIILWIDMQCEYYLAYACVQWTRTPYGRVHVGMGHQDRHRDIKPLLCVAHRGMKVTCQTSHELPNLLQITVVDVDSKRKLLIL